MPEKISPSELRENDLNAPFLAPGAQPSPTPGADLLSQVLSLVRLRGESVIARSLDAGPISDGGGPARFYVVEDGVLELASTGHATLLRPGDVALLPHGAAHTLAPHATANSGECRLIAGVFHVDTGTLPPVLSTLPQLIHVPAPVSGMPPWLAAISRFLVEEARTPAPGADLMVSRLIDLLVIRALRSWAATSGGHFALVSALGDERLSRALSALHATPVHPWTVPELAAVAAMSRSSFARHFNAVLGEPPLRYLARWRLHLASEMLRSGTLRVSDAAQRVGYASEAAFSRAFKACFGHSPKQAVADGLSGPGRPPR